MKQHAIEEKLKLADQVNALTTTSQVVLSEVEICATILAFLLRNEDWRYTRDHMDLKGDAHPFKIQRLEGIDQGTGSIGIGLGIGGTSMGLVGKSIGMVGIVTIGMAWLAYAPA